MKINQRERILEMLRNSPTRTVTCKELAAEFLYHKAASRIGEIERQQGHEIHYIKGPTVMEGKYVLVHDAQWDGEQRVFA